VCLDDTVGYRQPQPTPFPSDLVVKKGSKILARFSGGMPSPLSATVSISIPSAMNVVTETRPGRLSTPLLWVAFRGVEHQVQHHLLDLRWIAEHRRAALRSGSASTDTLLSFNLCCTSDSVMRTIRFKSAGARCGLPRREKASRSLTMCPTREVSLITCDR